MCQQFHVQPKYSFVYGKKKRWGLNTSILTFRPYLHTRTRFGIFSVMVLLIWVFKEMLNPIPQVCFQFQLIFFVKIFCVPTNLLFLIVNRNFGDWIRSSECNSLVACLKPKQNCVAAGSIQSTPMVKYRCIPTPRYGYCLAKRFTTAPTMSKADLIASYLYANVVSTKNMSLTADVRIIPVSTTAQKDNLVNKVATI